MATDDTSSEIAPVFYSIDKYLPNLWPDTHSANSYEEKKTMLGAESPSPSTSSSSIDVFCDCSSDTETEQIPSSRSCLRSSLCNGKEDIDKEDLNFLDSKLATDCKNDYRNDTAQIESVGLTSKSDIIPTCSNQIKVNMNVKSDCSDTVSLGVNSVSSDDSGSLNWFRLDKELTSKIHDGTLRPDSITDGDSASISDIFLDENDEGFDAYQLLMSIIEDQDNHRHNLERMNSTNSGSSPPPYPHHPVREMECEICLSRSEFGSRFCCRFKACDECINTYLALKIQEANVHVECPNDKCKGHLHRNEIRHRLSQELRVKYDKFLIDANKDPCKKTCPACSSAHSIDPDVLSTRKKLKNGLEVSCSQCKLLWCFLCQAPFHYGITCKQFVKGDELLRSWAKEVCQGKANAQRCPKCKTFIQKAEGCDHMKCSQCGTDFCYRCGDRYIRVKFIGNHFSRYSLFGCKYRLLPQKPALRKFIRGSNFAARLVGCVLLGGLGLAAGVGLIGASVFILPTYGAVRLRRRMKRREKRRGFEERMRRLVSEEAERIKGLIDREIASNANLSTIHEESDVDNLDTQQVEVMVHRSVSVGNGEEASTDCELYANRFTAEGTEVVVTPSTDSMVEGHDNIVLVTDFKEVKNKGGYSTVVVNIVSEVGQGDATKDITVDLEKTDVKNVEENVPYGEGVEFDANEDSVSVEQNQDRKLFAKVEVDSEVEPSDTSHTPSNLEISIQDLPTSICNTNSDSVITADDVCQISIDDNKSSKLEGKMSPKEVLPGCFGNMFSKCSQITSSSSESLTHKNHELITDANIIHKKSATWEKTGKSKVGMIYNVHQKNCSKDIKTALWQTYSSADDLCSSNIHSPESSPLSIRGDNQEVSLKGVSYLDGMNPKFNNSSEDELDLDVADEEIKRLQEDLYHYGDVQSIHRAPCSITTHM